ncbi:MAG TPA: AarF/UbiB family protein, partial [Burkholderiales bacterium]|nr:AarF/UbiB family protein [Burkholderiales bacterium]
LRAMALSLKPEHLRHYKNLALLLFRYGRRDVVARAGLNELLPQEAERDEHAEATAEQLAADVERLGPTYIKLGQLLSTRPDIVPAAYAQALARLQDRCEPLPFEQIEQVLAEELGLVASRALRVDREPLATASMSQVHRASLEDGREIVLKVQRPGLREQVLSDLEALDEVAGLLRSRTDFCTRYGIDLLFEEFRKSLVRELDFRQEAMHLLTISANLREIEEIVLPQPIIGYTTSRVLAMEFIAGTKVTELSRLERRELGGEQLIDALFRAYLKQILRDGLFHADPHPGNIFLVGERIALIDLGMVARLSPGLQERLLQMLLAVSDNHSDEAAKALLAMGQAGEDADIPGFHRAVADLLAQHHEMSFEPPQVGRAVLMLLKAAGDNRIRLPVELAMIGKTLLNLDQIAHVLAPHFDPNAAIRRHAADITQRQVARDLSLSSLFSTAVEMKSFVQHLPGRVNRILDRLADNEFQVRVDAIDETRLMEGLQKVANRIALGLVLAALIVGAALMMDVPTSFVIFGYPGVAILLFLAAAGGGAALAITILANDIRAKRRAKT